jgi:predicted porin
MLFDCRGAEAADDAISWHGITLYGTLDIGYAYQNHGAPLSQDMYTGLAYMISKNSHEEIQSVAPNGLSQSKIGIKGNVPVNDYITAVFNFESGINPESGKLSNALAALVHNNGKAPADQATGADGSRAGQLFNGPAFVGAASTSWGMLTLGRHNTFLTDVDTRFDPLHCSYAFSVLGASGTAAGGGYTQDARLDNSVKYSIARGWLHAGVLYQPGDSDSSPGRGLQSDVGFVYEDFAADFVYAEKRRAMLAASLSAAQLATEGVPHDSLAATISDNQAFSLAASYKRGDPWTLSGGIERIRYRNPEDPLEAGFSGLGGYYISFVNNDAYPHDKVLMVGWAGVTRQIGKLSATVALYHYNQNSYALAQCSDRSSSMCSGNMNAYSAVLDYRLDAHFDFYGGVMYSQVGGGLASGYLYSSTYDPMIGLRVQF